MREYTQNRAVPFTVHNTAATPEECARVAAFYDAMINTPAAFPCSFALDGVEYKGLGEMFVPIAHETGNEELKLTDTLTFRHTSGLLVEVQCALYPQHAAVDWTLWFKNDTNANSPRISALNGCDTVLPGVRARLRGILGDARNEVYGPGDMVSGSTYGMNNEPYDRPLPMGLPTEMHPVGGCSCNHEYPYFNIQTTAGNVSVAIGWPGQWKAELQAGRAGVHLTTGQQTLDTFLYPSEAIRTPLTCLMFMDGDDDARRINLWRRFMMECNMPRKGGVISQPTLSSAAIHTGMTCFATEENQIECIRDLRECGIDIDNWWMDAGWYYTSLDGKKKPAVMDDYGFLGDWLPRKEDFPTDMKAVSDCMAETGGDTLLWFEPERFSLELDQMKDDGSTVKREWLLHKSENFVRPRENGSILMPIRFVDLGIPEAEDWMFERISGVLERGGIGIYREDHNIRPLEYWQATDAPDRPGMVENKYITAHLRLWDRLRERFGGMIIDSCASGGRRNDLESMRRAVPLHYTDFFIYDMTRQQAVQSSLFTVHPYFKSGYAFEPDKPELFEYNMRSGLTPFTMVNTQPGLYKGEAGERARAYVAEWRAVNKSFYADYYMLTEWNVDDASPLAYEFIDSVTGEGFVQVYRRPLCDEPVITLPLKGLQPEKKYHLTGYGCVLDLVADGAALAKGLEVLLETAPAAATVKIEPAE